MRPRDVMRCREFWYTCIHCCLLILQFISGINNIAIIVWSSSWLKLRCNAKLCDLWEKSMLLSVLWESKMYLVSLLPILHTDKYSDEDKQMTNNVREIIDPKHTLIQVHHKWVYMKERHVKHSYISEINYWSMFVSLSDGRITLYPDLMRNSSSKNHDLIRWE